MKRTIIVLGLASLVIVGAAPASAAIIIRNIADDSSATVTSSSLLSFLVRNNNNAVITNTISASANTGHNDISSADDMSEFNLLTGAADSGSVVENIANTTTVELEAESASGGDVTIEEVADGSDATVEVVADEVFDAETNNDVVATNDVVAESNTGSNAIDSGDSLSKANVTTGRGTSLTGVSNIFNIIMTKFTRTIGQ